MPANRLGGRRAVARACRLCPIVTLLPARPSGGYVRRQHHRRAGTRDRLQGVDTRWRAAPQALRTIRAGKVVLADRASRAAAGFPGNDRPGVMLVKAAERFAGEYGVLPGEKVAVFTNNDGAYRSALELREAGCRIVAIVDVREETSRAARALVRAHRRRNPHRARGDRHRRAARRSSGIKVQAFDARAAP